MVKPDFDYERCIVGVKVNGELKGTGFVIGPGKVLTCAHVIDNEDEQHAHDALIEIFFLTSESGRDTNAGGSTTWQMSTNFQEVSIHSQYSCPSCEHDIAVLSWDGPLPPGVQVARLSNETELAQRSFRTRGYPNLGDYKDLPGKGTVVGKSQRDNGIVEWSLDSREITRGFSGAPLFDDQTGMVIGMARAIVKASPAKDGQLLCTAFAVTCESIRAVCGDLFAALDQEIERKHKEAMDRLRDKMVEILVGCPQALESLEQALAIVTDTPKVKDRASAVANVLIDHPSIAALSGKFIRLLATFAKAKDDAARETVSAIYLAIVSAILHPEMVRQLRHQLDKGQSKLMVLCDFRPVAELILAGIDGRIGGYSAWGDDPEAGFRGSMELDLFDEEGIVDASKVNQQKLLIKTRDKLGLPRWGIRPSALPEVIDGYLTSHITDRNQRFYIVCVDVDGTEVDPVLVDEISRLFPSLALVYLVDPEDPRIREAQSTLITVMNDPNFTPPRRNPNEHDADTYDSRFGGASRGGRD